MTPRWLQLLFWIKVESEFLLMTMSHETLANLAASPREIVLLGVKPNLPSIAAETSILFHLQDRSASLGINMRVELLPGHGFQLRAPHVPLCTIQDL